MGLDSVELVMALEEEFGIELADRDVEGIQTPREVIDLITRMVYRGQGRCTSRAGFYQLRRACISALGVSRSQVRPETQLAMLLPEQNMQTFWSQLREGMAMEADVWPQLEYPKAVNWLRVVTFLCVVIGCTAVAGQLHFLAGFVMFIFSLRIAWWVDDRLTEKLGHRRILLPKKLVTIADLIDAVVPREWTKAKGIISEWDRERVARRVKAIVIEQLGIEETEYHEDARFIEDLGMG